MQDSQQASVRTKTRSQVASPKDGDTSRQKTKTGSNDDNPNGSRSVTKVNKSVKI